MDLQFNFLGFSLQFISYYSQKFYCHLFWSASNDNVDTASKDTSALDMMPIVNFVSAPYGHNPKATKFTDISFSDDK